MLWGELHVAAEEKSGGFPSIEYPLYAHLKVGGLEPLQTVNVGFGENGSVLKNKCVWHPYRHKNINIEILQRDILQHEHNQYVWYVNVWANENYGQLFIRPSLAWCVLAEPDHLAGEVRYIHHHTQYPQVHL